MGRIQEEISPEFVRAVYNSRIPVTHQARHAGFTSQPSYRRVLRLRKVIITPLLAERLARVVELIEYKGPLTTGRTFRVRCT